MPHRAFFTTGPTGRLALVTDRPEVERAAAEALRCAPVPSETLVLPIDECAHALSDREDAELPDVVLVAGASAESSARCVAELRAQDERRIVPIVVLCPSDDPDLQACLRAGANAVLPSDSPGGVAEAIGALARFWLSHNRLLRAHH